MAIDSNIYIHQVNSHEQNAGILTWGSFKKFLSGIDLMQLVHFTATCCDEASACETVLFGQAAHEKPSLRSGSGWGLVGGQSNERAVIGLGANVGNGVESSEGKLYQATCHDTWMRWNDF